MGGGAGGGGCDGGGAIAGAYVACGAGGGVGDRTTAHEAPPDASELVSTTAELQLLTARALAQAESKNASVEEREPTNTQAEVAGGCVVCGRVIGGGK